MVFSIATRNGRRQLKDDAARSRACRIRSLIALSAVIIYNLTGLADIYSTYMAISSGLGEEANPFIRTAMEYTGHGWILAKLILQGVVSFMVLWFPHWIIIGFFSAAIAGNVWIVHNNFIIAGLIA